MPNYQAVFNEVGAGFAETPLPPWQVTPEAHYEVNAAVGAFNAGYAYALPKAKAWYKTEFGRSGKVKRLLHRICKGHNAKAITPANAASHHAFKTGVYAAYGDAGVAAGFDKLCLCAGLPSGETLAVDAIDLDGECWHYYGDWQGEADAECDEHREPAAECADAECAEAGDCIVGFTFTECATPKRNCKLAYMTAPGAELDADCPGCSLAYSGVACWHCRADAIIDAIKVGRTLDADSAIDEVNHNLRRGRLVVKDDGAIVKAPLAYGTP